MSINDWRNLEGNLNKGGNVRGPGEEEPKVPTKKSNHQEETRKKELLFVRDLLINNHLTAVEVLNNDNYMIWAEKEFRKGQFRFGTLKKHLETLIAERNKK